MKLLSLSNFTFLHNVFLKPFFFNVLKRVYMKERVFREGLNIGDLNERKWTHPNLRN